MTILRNAVIEAKTLVLYCNHIPFKKFTVPKSYVVSIRVYDTGDDLSAFYFEDFEQANAYFEGVLFGARYA